MIWSLLKAVLSTWLSISKDQSIKSHCKISSPLTVKNLVMPLTNLNSRMGLSSIWIPNRSLLSKRRLRQTTKMSFFGGTGNDSLQGNDGNDVLEGGIGNDTLSGRFGNDLYLFNLGDGQDVISDYNFLMDVYFDGNSVDHEGKENLLTAKQWWELPKSDLQFYENESGLYDFGADVIEFGDGIKREDLVFTNSSNSLVIGIKGTNDKISLENFFSDFSANWEYPVKNLEFSGWD